MLVFFFKAEQLSLFPMPTMIAGHVRKDGVRVAPHMAMRRRKISDGGGEGKPAPRVKAPKLDRFIAKHGGPDRFRATLMDLNAEQRAKLVDAMSHMDGISTAEVISRLGMHEEKAPEAPKEATEAEPKRVDAAPQPDGPQEGDRKTEDGVEYELRDGRWHRVTPEPEAEPEAAAAEEEPAAERQADPDFEGAEDRQDLAEAMAKDPHSDESRKLIRKVASRELPAQSAAPADDLDPSSPNYRYRDTGYVAGSRKEMAATMIRRMARSGESVRVTDIDWDGLEENPREAKELITKENLFGSVGWETLRDAGMSPGAGFLVSKAYAAVAAKPVEDSPAGRRDYSLAITTLRDRMEACRSPEQVINLLAEIREERDGELLNERESQLYAQATEHYREFAAKVRATDQEADRLYKEAQKVEGQVSEHRREIDSRKRRKWAPKPELEQLVARLTDEAKTLREQYIAYRKANGMEPIIHKTEIPGGVSTRFEYPYKADMEKALGAMRGIKALARMRNAEENPLTRAWKSLGDSFNGVLEYRSHKGSQAYAKHVATAKAGRVTTWDWAEKKAEPRGASKQSTSFQLLVADEIRRTGGPDVGVGSTAELKSEFNLRDVQSGNWVLDDPNAAKFHVESCAAAFADLADLLDIPRSEISFKGRLALAFGARGRGGKGAAKAHYEPVERVINMTKMAGAGSLAHEWFHCVDNLVKEAMTGAPAAADDFATVSPQALGHSELESAFGELQEAMLHGPHRKVETLTYSEAEDRWAQQNMSYGPAGGPRAAIKNARSMQEAVDAVEAMFQRGAFGSVEKKKAKNTRDNWRKIALIHHGRNSERTIKFESGPGMSMFMIDALDLDKGQPGKYWSAPYEMAARAFAGYVEDRLKAKGRENTYLVSQANNAIYRAMGAPHRPYPERDERDRVNAAFEKLFGVIQRENVLAKAAAALAAGDLRAA